VHGRASRRAMRLRLDLAQLNDELDRRASVSLEALQARAKNCASSWAVRPSNYRQNALGPRKRTALLLGKRQALVGWLDTIRRIAKATESAFSLLRAEAARKMSECRGAVPVWVMRFRAWSKNSTRVPPASTCHHR